MDLSEPRVWTPGTIPRGFAWLDRALNRPKLHVPFRRSLRVQVTGGSETVVLREQSLNNQNGLRLATAYLQVGNFGAGEPNYELRFYRGEAVIENIFMTASTSLLIFPLFVVYESGELIDIRMNNTIFMDTTWSVLVEGWYF